MARFRRRRVKARRGYASRRRRTIGKRRSFRRRGSSRRLVTRKTLRRALAPLRPEVKMLAFSNSNALQLLTYAESFTEECIPITVTTNNGTGSYHLDSLNVATAPVPITQIQTLGASAAALSAASSAPYTRIGRKVRIKRIDIKCRLSLQTNAASSYSSPTVSNVRCFLMRTGQVPQTPSQWGSSFGVPSGSSYPHWYLPNDAEAIDPYQWLYETSDDLSFPAQILTPGQRKSLSLARFKRVKMGARYNLNPADGTPYLNPAPGQTEHTFRWIIRPKGETLFNDRDESLSNGYFANNHYWISFATDNANVIIKANDLQWRMWFTDA